LVAVSIASDIVPIVNENRILAFYGLKKINKNPIIGIESIIEIAKIKSTDIKVNDIVFKIGPRINAAGRIEKGISAVDLLVCNDIKQAMLIAQKIDAYNVERRKLDSSITKEALELIKTNSLQNKKSTVLSNANWHKGVLGIVASRVIETYYRPTIIFTIKDGYATGSARSVKDFNLYKALEKCEHLMESFGGHKYAAGLTVKEENLEIFANTFEEIVSEMITPESQQEEIIIDEEISLSTINENFYDVLNQFEPFGPENMAPVFISKNVKDTGFGRCIGKDKTHLKITLADDSTSLKYQAIGFNLADKFDIIQNSTFDVCYNVEKNTFNGVTNIQLNIKDIKK
jgi:single-stranded-DNA-specific exonuclease